MDLDRFVRAQDDHETYDRALAELRAGRKTSHWVWFVFPQVSGLGQSPTAKHYELAGLEEARAYLDHDVLGPRLRECCRALLGLDEDATAERVLGTVDAMKLRSSMTLFAQADPDEPVFTAVLDRFYDGAPDERTIALLG
ncbi:DUF1810 domain-containing protein [Nocardioides pinisoli]|uniref:DUF1810 domain-containing protein n=1 Tax=Nocardioides pinisoli TaxID=2950279 RepID=A0ABT1KS34_9ACTN|nr:DUF1810 domain-containing protein [Nocardioides pinisoli]MCP3420553.1 DUF1810 domain-containing protein [Nocardioides pinisoli]